VAVDLPNLGGIRRALGVELLPEQYSLS